MGPHPLVFTWYFCVYGFPFSSLNRYTSNSIHLSLGTSLAAAGGAAAGVGGGEGEAEGEGVGGGG